MNWSEILDLFFRVSRLLVYITLFYLVFVRNLWNWKNFVIKIRYFDFFQFPLRFVLFSYYWFEITPIKFKLRAPKVLVQSWYLRQPTDPFQIHFMRCLWLYTIRILIAYPLMAQKLHYCILGLRWFSGRWCCGRSLWRRCSWTNLHKEQKNSDNE